MSEILLGKRPKNNNATGKNRRTLQNLEYTLEPQEILESIRTAPGYPYKGEDKVKEQYRKRDLALVSILYMGALRVSEALRLSKKQFKKKPGYVLVQSVLLSKRKKKDKPRKTQYREIKLPLKGERAELTQIILDYIDMLGPEEQLFKFKPSRALQTTKSLLKNCSNHWLRAFGESYLYSAWKCDLLAVADYVGVVPGTLGLYIKKSYLKYKIP